MNIDAVATSPDDAEPAAGPANIVPRTTITQICTARDAALAKMHEAASTLDRAYHLATEASDLAQRAHHGASFYLQDRTASAHYKRLFRERYDRTKSLEVFRSNLDACVWTHLFKATGIESIMDRTAREEFDKALMAEVPEVTIDNVSATLEELLSDADLIFKRGLARAFSDLDRRFRSHDGFKIGSRIILTNVFNEFGHWSYRNRQRDTIADIERVFAVLDGDTPNPGLLEKAISRDRGHSFGCRQSETVTQYFKVRSFMNGNAHIWFQRDDLVEKANKILAEFYGEVIGDAMTKEECAEDLKHRPGLPAKNLSFYPTPDPVVESMMRDVYFKPDYRVLEPSAGTGAIVEAVLDKGVSVDAIEIHPERARQLESIGSDRLTVSCANFLQLPPSATYDLVLMNPPFAGTHWMDHVMHAYEFLADGGTLVAILPASAEVNESGRHNAFRSWAKQRARYWRLFSSLPDESFASVGTRINTVILTLHK